MIQYEVIRNMPLDELLSYYQALKAICERHESELKPLYGSHNPNLQMKWIETNNELQHAKLYFDVVLNALKYKAFHGLDEYEPPTKIKKATKPIAKKSFTPSQHGRNVKKKDKE